VGAVASGAAYERLEAARWPDGARCPHCREGDVRYLAPRAPAGRRTRTGAPTGRRVWRCARCRRQFSVLTGTVWHGTRIALPTWVAVLERCAQTGSVPASARLRQEWPLSAEAARHVHRLLGAVLAEVGPTTGADGLLAAVLALPAADGEQIRRASARRPRPLRLHGPSRDYGSAES
jgi:transposase-like protein